MRGFIKSFAFVLLLFPTSCITYRYIDIQVLNPGSVRLPSDITLHVIENHKYNFDCNMILQDTLLDPNYFCKLLMVNFDSTFLNRIKESPKFDSSKIVLQKQNEFNTELSISPTAVSRRDVEMSIDKLDIIEGYRSLGYDYETFEYVASYSVYYKMKVELRNPSNNQPFDTSYLSDTLTWNQSSFSKEFAVNKLPSTSEAIAEVGQIIGEQYAYKIAPYWTTEERMLFYSNNKYMRIGYNHFLSNDLDGAIQTWTYLYKAGTPELSSIAAHNIGLVYEMLDDFTNSEIWLNNSLQTKYHPQTEKYLYRIKERKEGRTNLDEEMKP